MLNEESAAQNCQSVQSLSRVRLFGTPWTAAHQASLSITNSQTLLKLMFIELVMPSNHLIPCLPLLLLPSIFPSNRVFSNELVLHIGWPKYWSFSFNIGPSSEYSGLISFRIDWFDHLTVQGILKSLPQHHSSKTSILWRSAFFMATLTFIMTTGKTSFSSKEQVSFNFMAAVTICCDFGVPENKVCHCFHCFLIYLPWSDGTGS